MPGNEPIQDQLPQLASAIPPRDIHQEAPSTAAAPPDVSNTDPVPEFSAANHPWDASDSLTGGAQLNGKAALTTALSNYADELAASAKGEARAIVDELRSVVPIERNALESETLEQIRQRMKADLEYEMSIHERFERIQRAAALLESKVLREAKGQYQCSTGLLDDHPKLSAAICGALSVLSLGTGIYFAWATHGAVHHFVESVVHAAVGEGLFGSMLVYPAVLGALFLEGIPVLASAAVGPVAFGALKTIGGRIARTLSPYLRGRFDQERESSGRLLDKLHESARSLSESIETIKPLIPQFFNRNETLRSISSSKLLALARDERRSELAKDLQELNTKLGASELSTLVRFMNLEKRLNGLLNSDFRSPELAVDSSQVNDTTPKGWKHVIGSALAHTVGAIRGIAGSSRAVGTQTALNAADDLKDGSSHMPQNPILDPVSGSGTAIGSTVHLGIETFERPEKALLDAIKGFAGVASSMVSGAAPEGPSALTLLRVILVDDKLDARKLGHKPNLIRWGTEVLFTLALVLFKKPALAFKAQKREEESGKLSPHTIEADLAEDQGRVYSALKSVREIIRLSGAIAGGLVYNLGVALPLRTLSHLNPDQPIVGWISRQGSALLASFEKRRDARLARRLERALERHPHPTTLSTMDSVELEQHAFNLAIDYRYNRETKVTQDEMNSTLEYWIARRDVEWRQQTRHRDLYLTELARLAPGAPLSFSTILNPRRFSPPLKRLHFFLHPEDSGASSAMSVMSEVASKIRSGGAYQPSNIPLAFTPEFLEAEEAVRNGTQTFTSRPTIVDASTDFQEIVMVTASGQPTVLQGPEGRETLLAYLSENMSTASRGFAILPHADHARIAIAEMLLATPLEPFQRQALLSAHYDILNGAASVQDVTAHLLQNDFTPQQLFGTHDDSGERSFPGLFELGVIGR